MHIRQSAHLKKQSVSQQDNTGTPSVGHNLTRRDKAVMEAIQTFDGNNLGAVLKTSRKRVARHFDDYPTKRAKTKESSEELEDESQASKMTGENSVSETPSAG